MLRSKSEPYLPCLVCGILLQCSLQLKQRHAEIVTTDHRFQIAETFEINDKC